MRAARGGGWKASGGGQNLRWPRSKGGFFAGRMMTLVFYDRGVDKSKWGMHEFVVPVPEQEKNLTTPPTHVSISPKNTLVLPQTGRLKIKANISKF